MRKVTSIAISCFCTLLLCFCSLMTPVLADELISHAPANAKTYIIAPQDGERVPETFTVQFGLSGMEIAPAGVQQANSGHHHLLIDVAELPDLQSSLPANDKIRHFGKGQTETQLTLTPGEHTLQLLLGNYAHIPHNRPVISDKITISVQ